MAFFFSLPARLRDSGFTLRPEVEDDTPFLMELFGTTRAAELAQAPWSPEQKQAFVASQFAAQRHHYRAHHPDGLFGVLEQDGVRIGRIYLDEDSRLFNLIDIALLPQCCGKGTGTAILKTLMVLAAAAGKEIGIFVEKFNPALGLYRRLEFEVINDHGIYLEMRWPPPSSRA